MLKEIILCWNIKCKNFDLTYPNNCNNYFNHCTKDCKKFKDKNKVKIEKNNNEITIKLK